jgi:6-pyruvoyl-tetrahydropterin synthase
MKKFIVVRTQFEGIHSWPECPYKEVAFLKNPHRHLFYVELLLPIESDRYLEFFMIKSELDVYIREYIGEKNPHNTTLNLGSLSCEMIAENILDYFSRKLTLKEGLCVVSEDNENGSLITL